LAATGLSVLAFDVGTFFAAPVDDGLLEVRRLAMKWFPATRAVDRSRFDERVVERATAAAFGFERFVTADEAEVVGHLVCTKATADRAPFRELVGHHES
jgi:hypothetical protein